MPVVSGVSTVAIDVLGPVSVTVEGAPVPLTQAGILLVAAMVAAGDRGITPEALARERWHDDPPDTWSSSLRNAIAKINREFRKLADGEPLISSPQDGKRHLLVAPDHVDAWRLIATARHPPEGDLDPNLFRGEPYADCDGHDLLEASADQLRAARRDLIRRYLSAGGELTDQLAVAVDDLVAGSNEAQGAM